MPLLPWSIFVSPGLAATLIVDGGGSGYETISAALDAAVSGDRIEVDPGTWFECLAITKSVTLVGTAGSATTLVDGGGTCAAALTISREFSDVVLAGMTVNNFGARGIDASASALRLEDIQVDGVGSAVTTQGAGLRFDGMELVVEESTFSSNEAAACAAVSLAEGVVASFLGGRFDGNRAASGAGGAICVESSAAAPSTLTLSGVTFMNNTAFSGGAALFIGESGQLVSDASMFDANVATGSAASAGAVRLGAGASLLSTGDTFRGNGSSVADTPELRGAAITAVEGGAKLTIEAALFEANLSGATYGFGSAVFVADAELRVSASSFGNGQGGVSAWEGSELRLTGCLFGPEYGYPIYVDGGMLTDEGSQFIGTARAVTLHGSDASLNGSQFVENMGGALDFLDGGSLSLSGCSVLDSRHYAHAVVYVEGASSPVSVVDCAFERNWDTGDDWDGTGGALAVLGADLRVAGSTFSANSAAAGPAIYTWGGGLTLTDSVVEDNIGWWSAAVVFGETRSPLTVERSRFEGNGGGEGVQALHAWDVGDVVLTDTVFVDNIGSTERVSWGAVYIGVADSVHIDGMYACGNGGNYSGALSFYLLGSLSLHYAIFAENEVGGQGGAARLDYIPAIDIDHVTVVGNSASAGGGLWASLSGGSITNSIFAFTAAGDGLYAEDEQSAAELAVTFSDFYANTASDRGGYFNFDTWRLGNTTANPTFVSYSADGDCWNDDFALADGSPLIDAGSGNDADGSVADVGATGGEATPWPGNGLAGGDDPAGEDTADGAAAAAREDDARACGCTAATGAAPGGLLAIGWAMAPVARRRRLAASPTSPPDGRRGACGSPRSIVVAETMTMASRGSAPCPEQPPA